MPFWDGFFSYDVSPVAVAGIAVMLAAVMGRLISGFVERQSVRTRRLLTEAVKNGDLWAVAVDADNRMLGRRSSRAKVDEDETGSNGQSSGKVAPHLDASADSTPEALIPPDSADSTLLREYYTQGISQSKISFVASLVAASLGFFLILVACIRAIFPDPGADTALASVVTLVAGALVEAVAALFFTQSNRARVLMSDMHDRLRTDRKADREFDKAMALVDEIVTPGVKDQLKVDVARHFIGVRDNKSVLPGADKTPAGE